MDKTNIEMDIESNDVVSANTFVKSDTIPIKRKKVPSDLSDNSGNEPI